MVGARLVLLLLGCLLGAASASADDWPQWGGRDGRNMASGEKGLPPSFTPGDKRPDGSGIDPATARNVKWIARLGTQCYGNATVSGGRVFVGTNDEGLTDLRYRPTQGGVLKCLDEASGRPRWQLVVPRLVTNDPTVTFDNMGLGICSSPTVDGDRVYVLSNRCEVICLDARGNPNSSDARVLWRYDIVSQLGCHPHDAASSSPLVHGDFVYVATSNGVDKSNDRVPSPHCPSLIVLDKRTGRLVANDVEEIGTRLFHGQWSSPSAGEVDGRTLVFFGAGDGVCYAFEALRSASPQTLPLKKAWSFDCNPPPYRFASGKPIKYRDGDVRRKAGNNNDGSYLGPSEIIGTPVFYKQRVYVAIGQDPMHGHGRGLLWCIDATKTGDVSGTGALWSYDELDRSMSTASIADGLLYIADVAGDVHCLDADSGHCYWVYRTRSEIWGSTLVADGKVYVGNQKVLTILSAGKERKLLGTVRLGTPICSTAIAANGVLYVSSQRYLWAVRQRGK
jgi:outer membrane protein assembly factor BamB